MLVRSLSRKHLAVHCSHLSIRNELLLQVCAPTGSGKTNVAMLTILNVMNQFRLKATLKHFEGGGSVVHQTTVDRPVLALDISRMAPLTWPGSRSCMWLPWRWRDVTPDTWRDVVWLDLTRRLDDVVYLPGLGAGGGAELYSTFGEGLWSPLDLMFFSFGWCELCSSILSTCFFELRKGPSQGW